MYAGLTVDGANVFRTGNHVEAKVDWDALWHDGRTTYSLGGRQWADAAGIRQGDLACSR